MSIRNLFARLGDAMYDGLLYVCIWVDTWACVTTEMVRGACFHSNLFTIN